MARSGRWDKRGKSSLHFKQIALAAGAVALALMIFGFFAYKNLFDRPVKFDKETFCPEKIDDVTAVLIDATDTLSAVQRAAIHDRLDEIKDKLPKRARIDLYALGQDNDGMPHILFSMCNPGTGADADKLSENARLMKKHWTQDFSLKIEEELEALLNAKEAPNSPIMQSIQAVAIQSFGTSMVRDASSKQLVIVSDMIESTKEYSQYGGVKGETYGNFRKTDYFRKVQADLRHADVKILYVRRETKNHVQGNEHFQFWEKFIHDSSGRLHTFIPIEG